MKIFRIIGRALFAPFDLHLKDSMMPGFKLASASILAMAVALTACSDDKDNTAVSASNTPTQSAPAAPAVVKAESSPEVISAYTEAQAKAVVNHYADIAHATFEDATISAKKLQKAIDAFMANPTAETQAAAKQAWVDARVPYMQTEVFRFGNTIVDDWEGQVNAWPLDEGLIDYVADDYEGETGNPAATANIIANKTIQVGEDSIDVSNLTPELLADLNELAGIEANVTTGYHAIEFLLWGQDLNGTGPGAGERSYTDYLQGDACTNGNCDRRVQYLKAVTDLLVTDLEEMTAQWKAGVTDNYRAELTKESGEAGIRKMLFGMGSLSLGELAGERMKVALEAFSPEDEHDCFSDNTHNSHFYNGLGIKNVYLGQYKRIDGTLVSGPSLSELVNSMDPAADKAMKEKFEVTQAALQAIVDSAEKDNVMFDMLIDPENTKGHEIVRTAIKALVDQTSSIESVAAALNINELNPDTADHEF